MTENILAYFLSGHDACVCVYNVSGILLQGQMLLVSPSVRQCDIFNVINALLCGSNNPDVCHAALIGVASMRQGEAMPPLDVTRVASSNHYVAFQQLLLRCLSAFT